MLKLKRVEIQGFKSFCDRTEMRFSGSGIAGIVGPNGCGKSNVSDAISWVLGEQSAKSLRGGSMQDVIFAGTGNRKPLGMAQVTLVLVDPYGKTEIPGAKPDPSKGHVHKPGAGAESAAAAAVEVLEAPPEKQNGHGRPHEQEITVTRRLFRSGESEYLINGHTSRLRDIQELFMGTGLGPESYAIIEQGRVGQILSSKPLDRRGVIEEAAGISKFKTKRRLAEAKLEGAKQNLERVFDILEEVGRQAGSLKRQAAKAERYQKLKGELDVQLRLALTGRFRVLERETARVALELNLAAQRYQDISTQVDADERALTAARETCYQTDAQLTAARQRLSGLELEAERSRGQLAGQSRQAADIEQRLAQGEGEMSAMETRLAALAGEREAQAAVLGQLSQQAEEARERLRAKNLEREAAQGELRGREQALETARQQALRLLGEAATLKNQVAQIEAFQNSLERDTARVTREEQVADADIARLEALRGDLSGRLAARQMELETMADRRRRLEEDLSIHRQSAAETRTKLDALRGETSRLRARRDSLEEILSHRAYTTESVKRLFTAIEHGKAREFKPAGVLADFVDLTDTRFEKATEEFLHEELEYVVVKSWDDAQRGVELLRSDVDGRATFLVEPSLGEAAAPLTRVAVAEPPLGPETGIAGRLSDGLRFTNGLTNAPAALLPRLARCFLAETREAAQQLAGQYPDLYFLLEDGVCYHGHAVSGGRKTGAGPLALKRELRELIGAVEARQTAVAASEDELARLENEIQALGEDLEKLRGEQQRQEKETLVLDQEMRKTAEELNRSNQRLSVARIELGRLQREGERAAAQREEKLQQVAERERARGEQEQAFESGRAELETLKARVTHLAEEHSVLRVELAGFEERHRAVEAALQRLDAQVGELERRRRELAAEMDRLGVERARLLESNMQLDARVAALAAEVEAAGQAVQALATAEAEQRAALAASEEALKQLRAAAAEAHEQRGQVELELVRRQSELKFLDETCRKELQASLEELTAGQEAQADDFAVAEAEEKVNELRQRIDALGPVNPEALGEYKEAQQRYEFLNTQRQDLLDSIRDTEKAIQDIDVESRKRFKEAFEVINENFKVMFGTLFGGGTGEMRLTGDENVLDAGIELVAQPPGKRLQNVLLLSGGEKALTAIALLMAIFQYQPSPFCILDEVDAPLDEANVGRFTQLISDMAAQTQFIVITHAKKTMEAAQALYGVTMQEQGVSRLVSVRFNAAVPPPAGSGGEAARMQ